MAITLAQWEALETKIVADWTEGVHTGSYSIARRSWSVSSLAEQRKLLQYVQSQIESLTAGSPDGEFQLARFADL